MMTKYSTALSILFSIAALHVHAEGNYSVNVKIDNLTDTPVTWNQTDTITVDGEQFFSTESLLAHGTFDKAMIRDQDFAIILSDFSMDEMPCMSDKFISHTSSSSDLSLEIVLEEGQCIVREQETANIPSVYSWW